MRVEDSPSLQVNSSERAVIVPTTKQRDKITNAELAFLIPHELIHTIRGFNGATQDTPLFATGEDGYLATEEGTAIIAELMNGQELGDPRQRKQAARYTAAAMPLKTKEVPISEAPGETETRTVAKYSIQEIYDTLRESYAVNERDAKDIVWRIMRGTSLQREVTKVELDGVELPVAEVFVKDAVYFTGMMQMCEYFLEVVPGLDSDQDMLSTFKAISQLLSRETLDTIGRSFDALLMSSGIQNDKFGDRAEEVRLRHLYARLGEVALTSLFKALLSGKITLETLKDKELARQLRPATLNYVDIFKQKKMRVI